MSTGNRQDEPIKLPEDFEDTLAALLAVEPEGEQDESDDDQATADSEGSE